MRKRLYKKLKKRHMAQLESWLNRPSTLPPPQTPEEEDADREVQQEIRQIAEHVIHLFLKNPKEFKRQHDRI